MRRIKGMLSYANVISTLCLFMLLGGAAYAATSLPKNSVGTKQLKNSAVTGAKIKKHTITGTNINLAKLGTVPSAGSASTATTAGTANALSAMEPTRHVGASGQPPFLDGATSFPEKVGIKFQAVGFYKDHEGIVHLTGIAEVGKEEKPVHGLLFTLPPGYRPTSGVTEVLPGSGSSGVYVFGSNVTFEGHDLSGDVFSTAASESPAFLSGITFRAES